jgi:hypothetical protein
MNPFTYELKRLKRYRKRAGRCHELATRLLLFLTTRDDIVLVQGTVFAFVPSENKDLEILHSWIEHVPTGMVLDPVDAQVFEGDEYRDLNDAKIIGKFTREEVSRKIYEDRHNLLYFSDTAAA